MRSVLVTGGASGIGLAIAGKFASLGDCVYVCDTKFLDQSELDPKGIKGIEADVSNPHDVDRMFSQIASNTSAIDVLVNNAGIGGPRTSIEETDEEQWLATIGVNLNGAFFCTKHAARMMKDKGRGAIINISTASVRTGLPNRTPYIASKAGMMGLTLNTARELGPFNIRCNAVLPGLIDNPRGRQLVKNVAINECLDEDAAEAAFLRYVSMRTWIGMDEIADMVAFLASDEAKHVSGQYIGVDGHMEWET